MASKAFLYDRIAAELRHRIETGVYPPLQKLPSIDELVGEFKSSNITVRRALNELIAKGLIISRQGQGNFVRDSRKIVRHVQPGHMLLNDLSEDIRKAGLEPGVRQLELTLQSPTVEQAEKLRLSRGEKVYRMTSLVLADNIPIAYDHCYIPQAMAEGFGDRLQSTFVVTLLREAGYRIRHMELFIEVIAAEEPELTHLDVPKSFPLLGIRYTPISATGHALITGHFTSRGDRLAYSIDDN
ncbi:MAG TPA: GntR family transcriptional regulator [Bordetella sp.]